MAKLTVMTKNEFPLEVTDKAIRKAIDVRQSDSELGNNFNIRVSCKGGSCAGISFNIDFDDEIEDSDWVKEFSVEDETIKVLVDTFSAPYLEGVVVDFVKNGLSEGFTFTGGDHIKRRCGCGNSFSID